MALPANFIEEIRSVVAQIPAGRVATYGAVAKLVGMPNHARHVGHALARGCCKGLACYRVVNAAGRTVPGWLEQRTQLEAEGVRFRPNGCVDLRTTLWEAVREISAQ